MYFIFEIEFKAQKSYIKNLIKAYIDSFNIDAEVIQSAKKIYITINKDEPKTEEFFMGLESILPASLFMKSSKYYFSDEKPTVDKIEEYNLPINISLCPNCQKEMFDISSNRYYYPFTSCNSCGGQLPFLLKYPFNRKNSSFKFLIPCSNCQEELKSNPFRKDYPLISCIDCGVALKMNDGKSERYANDKGTYRRLFEVAAKAINKGKTILVKTLNGYRKFFIPKAGDNLENSILLFCDSNSLNSKLMLIPQEFNALLSIERPILRISTKSDDLKELFGSSVYVKYPDDGITMLLAKEALNLGHKYICYQETDENEKADFLIDFDLPIEPQKDVKLFINQDKSLFVSGERVVYPIVADNPKKVLTIANSLVASLVDETTIIDSMERFDSVEVREVRVLESEPIKTGHKRERRFKLREASMLSVLKEHNLLEEKAIGVHFDSNLYFLYYNGAKVIDVIKPIEFNNSNLWDEISSLREGSDRLVVNFKKKFPQIYEELQNIDGKVDIFKIASKIIGLKGEGIDAISKEALNFYGKGGILIDTKIKDERFDTLAFLASIISYKLADVESAMLCYSIYESFGDYIGEVVAKLKKSLKVNTITLSGESFANQALFAKVEKNIGLYKPLMNKNLPLGKENAVFGALYL